jgi:hypothetical protein
MLKTSLLKLFNWIVVFLMRINKVHYQNNL